MLLELGWTHAFKDPTGLEPVNVMVQQDAQEFLGVCNVVAMLQCCLTKKCCLFSCRHCFKGLKAICLCPRIVCMARGSRCWILFTVVLS